MSDKWDNRFIALARHVAEWSKDDSTKVGAVIVTPDHRVVSVGFNGYPKGVDDTILSRDQKLFRTIHAEANAIHFAGQDVAGCTLYVTHPPCSHCAAHIVQRSLFKVVYPKPPGAFIERWRGSHEQAVKMFKEAGVFYTEIR